MLLAVARNPDASVAKIAETAEITERSTYRVLADLQQAGYVRRSRHGRQNRYEINRALPLRDANVAHGLVRDLLKLVVEEEGRGAPPRRPPGLIVCGKSRRRMPQLSGFEGEKSPSSRVGLRPAEVSTGEGGRVKGFQ